MGLLERHGKIKVKHIPNAKRQTVQAEVRQHVQPGSKVYTDALASYNGFDKDYVHRAIDHAECHVKGRVHTNGLESFWCLLKRCFKGKQARGLGGHRTRYAGRARGKILRQGSADFEKAESKIALTPWERCATIQRRFINRYIFWIQRSKHLVADIRIQTPALAIPRPRNARLFAKITSVAFRLLRGPIGFRNSGP